MTITGNKLVQEKSAKEIADEIYNSFNIDSEFNFEERYIDYWLKFFRQIVSKLISFLKSNNQDIDFLCGKEGLKNAWKYLNNFSDDTEKYSKVIDFSKYFYEKHMYFWFYYLSWLGGSAFRK